MAQPSPRRFPCLPTAALGLALACAAALLLAGPGYRLGWWPLGPGLQIVRWAATAALVATLLGLIALGLAWRAGDRRALLLAALGLLVALASAGPPLLLYRKVQELPKIHDASTDTGHPPEFVAVLPLRRGARNPVDYPPQTAAEQRRAYPDLAPLQLPLPPAQVLALAERSARAMGWEIVAVDPQTLRLEATDTSLLFGFKDDVVVRISPDPAGSRVDMRSLSRVGGSDFGVNAQRIRCFMARLAEAARPG